MAFQGSLKELPLPDVIQLVAAAEKTGAFLLRDAGSEGKIFLRRGRIVHARTGSLAGEEAFYALSAWGEGEFRFDAMDTVNGDSIDKSNTELLMEAARRIDEWRVLAQKIPSTRLIPTFLPAPSEGSVSFSPKEWRVVQKVDERRSIDELASVLGQSSLDTAKVLYGLISSGIVILREPDA
jgi:hypothetical protein